MRQRDLGVRIVGGELHWLQNARPQIARQEPLMAAKTPDPEPSASNRIVVKRKFGRQRRRQDDRALPQHYVDRHERREGRLARSAAIVFRK